MEDKNVKMADETEKPGKPEAQPQAPKEEVKENQSTELIDKANAAAERLEKANAKLEENISKQEALAVEKTLGGQADAGVTEQEETPQEYAKKVMKGEE